MGCSRTGQPTPTNQEAEKEEGMIRLIDGSRVKDPRLGRIRQYDARTLNYPIKAVLNNPVKPRSMTWLCTTYLDQGNIGACVGFAVAHEAIARPDIIPDVNYTTAMKVYRRAQELDPWPGTDYEGTSVLAGLKAAMELGWYTEYRWAWSLDELILGIGHHGPAILGINWYDGLFTPDSRGNIKISGSVAGGHAIMAVGVSVPKRKFRLHNSWNKGWGINGDAFISFDDMERLLNEQGEAAFPRPAARNARRYP